MIDRIIDRRGADYPVRVAISAIGLFVIPGSTGWLATPVQAQVTKQAQDRTANRDAPASKAAPAPTPPKGITLKETLRFTGIHDITCITFSPDSRTIAAAGGTLVNFWGDGAARVHGRLVYHEDQEWFRNLHSIVYSPDGRTLAGGGDDGLITIWDITNGQKRLTITGHQEGDPSESAHPIWKLAFSPDGKLLASASWDDTARIWDVNTGKPLHILKHPGKVRTLDFSPDGRVLATGMGFEPEDNVILWEADSGKELARLEGDPSGTSCMAFAPNGRVLATAGSDHQVRLWDADSRAELAELSGHTEEVTHLVFSPDSRWLVSASRDYRVNGSDQLRIWDMTTGQARMTLHGDPIGHCVAFAPDGRSLVTSSGGKAVKHWNFHSEDLEPAPGQPVMIPSRALRVDGGRSVRSLAVSPDGRTLALASDRVVTLYDFPSRAVRATLAGHHSSVMQVVFSPDGNTLASSSADAQVRLWDMVTAREKNKLDRVYVTTFPIAFTPDGQSVVVSWRDNFTRAWDVSTGSLSDLFNIDRIGPLVYSPDGRLLATAMDGARDGTIRLLGTAAALGGAPPMLQDLGQSHATSASFVPPPVPVGGVEHSASSGFVPTPVPVARDFTASSSIQDLPPLPEGSSDQLLTGHSIGNAAIRPGAPATRETTCLAFAPDGQTLAAGEWNHGNTTHDVVIWNIPNGQMKARLTGQTSAIRGVAYSHDGRWLAAVSGDNTGPAHDGEARIWDARTNKERARLVGHRGPIWALGFTIDGRTLITAGADGIVRFWDMPAR